MQAVKKQNDYEQRPRIHSHCNGCCPCFIQYKGGRKNSSTSCIHVQSKTPPPDLRHTYTDRCHPYISSTIQQGTPLNQNKTAVYLHRLADALSRYCRPRTCRAMSVSMFRALILLRLKKSIVKSFFFCFLSSPRETGSLGLKNHI
jgi:hypothetical protein